MEGCSIAAGSAAGNDHIKTHYHVGHDHNALKVQIIVISSSSGSSWAVIIVCRKCMASAPSSYPLIETVNDGHHQAWLNYDRHDKPLPSVNGSAYMKVLLDDDLLVGR